MQLRVVAAALSILLLPVGLAQASEDQQQGGIAVLQESIDELASVRQNGGDEPAGHERSMTLDEALADLENARLANLTARDGGATPASAQQPRAAEPSQAQATLEAFDLARIGGENRYDTAAQLGLYANAAYFELMQENSPIVFVTTGLDYPDALAASAVQCPILLTERDSVPVETMAAIQEIDPEQIVVVGGTGVISTDVEQYLSDNSRAEVVRLSGEDRYGTAASISQSFGVTEGIVYLGTGEDFPDALAAGPAAGYEGASVLLTRRDSLPPATAAELERINPEQVVVVGGPAAVSDAVLSQAGQYAVLGAVRRAGEDRYATAVEVGRPMFTVENTSEVLLATGYDFPDALAAGPAAYWSGGPVLLMTPFCSPAVVQDRIAELQPFFVTLVGGEGAIANGAVDVRC